MKPLTTIKAIGAAALLAAIVGIFAPSTLAGGGERAPDPPPSLDRPARPAGYTGYLCPIPEQFSQIAGDEARNPDRFDSRELKGLTVRRAGKVAAGHDCSVRVVRRDGEDLIVTEDYSSQRINVGTRDGIVKRIHGIF